MVRRINIAVIGWLVWTRWGDRFLRRHSSIDRRLDAYITKAIG